MNISKTDRKKRTGQRTKRFNANRDLSEFVENLSEEEVDQRREKLKNWLKNKANGKAAKPKPFVVPSYAVKKTFETKRTFIPPAEVFPKRTFKPVLATHSEISSVRLTKAAEMRMKALSAKVKRSPKVSRTSKERKKSSEDPKALKRNVSVAKEPTKQDLTTERDVPMDVTEETPEGHKTSNNAGNFINILEINEGGAEESTLNMSFRDFSMSSVNNSKRRSVRLMKKSVESDFDMTEFIVLPNPEPETDEEVLINKSRAYIRDVVASGCLGSIQVYSSTPRSILKTKKTPVRPMKSVLFDDSVINKL